MSYMALYRKWRPVTFDGVKGQDHIVQTVSRKSLHGLSTVNIHRTGVRAMSVRPAGRFWKALP